MEGEVGWKVHLIRSRTLCIAEKSLFGMKINVSQGREEVMAPAFP